MAVLMNGKNVEHLVINGEAFDKRYVGSNIEILNTIFAESTIDLNGGYHEVASGRVILKGTKGFVTLFKYFNLYYIIDRNGYTGGSWCKAEDIKILD